MKNDIEIKCAKPSKKVISWAVDLTVQSSLTKLNTPLLKYSKRRSLTNTATRFIFALERKKEIGFCAFRMENKMAFIYEIHVDKDYRTQGIGRMLLNLCKETVEHIVENIYLQVHKKNYRAEKFYKENGFKRDIRNVAPSDYVTLCYKYRDKKLETYT